jgi:hypothetical protein
VRRNAARSPPWVTSSREISRANLANIETIGGFFGLLVLEIVEQLL